MAGGIGGAKLALGASLVLPRGELTILGNTGDDFEHLGLHISPDLDTVMYTLAGVADPETGWGRADETWSVMDTLETLGGPTWFRLGDRDLAIHLERTQRRARGDSLTRITGHLCGKLGVGHRLLPVTDQPLQTIVKTADGTLGFQEYFVAKSAEPPVEALDYQGARKAQMTDEVAACLARPDIAGIIIAPSNPWLSIAPMLAVPGFREALKAVEAARVAVSPIVGGQAIKGPAAKIMGELGLDVSARGIAEHYLGLVDGLVIDETDEALAPAIENMGLAVCVTQTVMRSTDDRVALARDVMAFAESMVTAVG